jgi:transaldolase
MARATVGETFFRRLAAETPTRVWVNNPTVAEIGLALAQGAVGCTTNPAYGGNLMKRAPDDIRPIIDACVRLSDDDDAAVADLVQRRLVARIVERFRPLYDASDGRCGYVSIQGDPEADTDSERILAAGRSAHALGPNAAPKIPATAPGYAALETLVAEGYPTIVTEVFSLSQLIEACERYVAVTARTGIRPPFFACPITGIFGDHLKALATRDGLAVSNEEMELIGVTLARECYRLVQERRYPVTLLCGGARVPFDLTGLVGGALHATINWSTFAEIMAAGTPLANGIDEPTDAVVIRRLGATFDDVRRALARDGLAVEEFEGFGPVQHFRTNFIAGWTAVREAIAVQRVALARAPR